MKKIILRLKGGLGNQLFIYAFGLAICRKTNSKVYFDMFSGFIVNEYKHLQTTKPLIKKYFKSVLTISFWHHLLFYLLRRLKKKKFLNSSYYLGELESLNFLENKILNGKGILFLEGYFQNFNFIKEVIPEIRNTIILKNLGEYQNVIQSRNSVAIHIRVNDYGVDFPEDYYQKAYLHMVKKVQNAKLYLFSDNLSWCSENLTFFDKCEIINTGDDEVDFHLMTLCNHHLITIGTFGWWAATLNKHEDAIVVAPIVEYNFYGSEYYPDNWVLL